MAAFGTGETSLSAFADNARSGRLSDRPGGDFPPQWQSSISGDPVRDCNTVSPDGQSGSGSFRALPADSSDLGL